MNDSDQKLIRYLLGEMSESEKTALEQQYFNDPGLFNRLVGVEHELLDNYARGRLAPEIRTRFESHYQSHPERRERLRFAQSLAAGLDQVTVVDRPRAPAESWWQRWRGVLFGPAFAWGFAAVCLILLIAGLWLVIEARRLHQEFTRHESERNQQEQHQRDLEKQLADERARADQLAAEVERLKTEPSPAPGPTPQSSSVIASLILTISDVRGGATGPPATLVIASEAEKVRIQLNLKDGVQDNEYRSYTIVVQSADGRQIFERAGLRFRSGRGGNLTAIAPASAFAKGDYILTLKGVSASGTVEDVSRSLFRVQRK